MPSVRVEAQAQLDRRAALAVISGESLGPAPLLWLIRQALDIFWENQINGSRKPILLHAVRGKRAHRSYWLEAEWASCLVELADGTRVGSYDGPRSALVLHNLVRRDPVAAERLLVEIEEAINRDRQ